MKSCKQFYCFSSWFDGLECLVSLWVSKRRSRRLRLCRVAKTRTGKVLLYIINFLLIRYVLVCLPKQFEINAEWRKYRQLFQYSQLTAFDFVHELNGIKRLISQISIISFHRPFCVASNKLFASYQHINRRMMDIKPRWILDKFSFFSIGLCYHSVVFCALFFGGENFISPWNNTFR